MIDLKKCVVAIHKKPACFLCWLYCPDAVISRTIPVQVDMEYCKGCGICAQMCPADAIAMVREQELLPSDAD